MLWTDTNRPTDIKKVVGNTGAVALVVKFFLLWEQGEPEKKAILLEGPPGCGKTLLAELCAERFGYDFFEVNASDTRNEDAVAKLVSTTRSGSLFEEEKGILVLFDEVDGMKGDADRGGMQSLCELIRVTKNPIVLTANRILSQRFSSLLNLCYTARFERLESRDIVKNLRRVCEENEKEIDEGLLLYISKICNGDMRRAINLLQTHINGNDLGSISVESVNSLEDLDSYDVVNLLFCAGSFEECVKGLRMFQPDPRMIVWWLSENLPHTIDSPSKIYEAFEYLKKASTICARNRWHVEDSFYVEIALAMMCKEKQLKYTAFPRYLRGIRPKGYIVELAADISRLCHVSRRYAMSRVLPFVRKMAIGSEESKTSLLEMGLNEESLNFYIANKGVKESGSENGW